MMEKVAAICLILIFMGGCSRPPSEATLIEAFNARRTAHEQLHEMLLADEGLLLVATWGVETIANRVPHKLSPHDSISSARYNEYLRLLGEVGGDIAQRAEGGNDTRVAVWAAGWASDTRHVAVSWRNEAPANQVGDLDSYRNNASQRQKDGVYRHVVDHWYLWADW